MSEFQVGEQIAYIPLHALGDIQHPDVEFGFVMSGPNHDGDYFCRYWRKGQPGILRTVSCSELTPGDMLHSWQIVSQSTVESAIVGIYHDQEKAEELWRRSH